ncbi:MAG: hypothetical protein JNM72_27460, partial [Deltaproteobacteria bacterium]|nr:hypothetical protein [Deltaproteobacteria bacterium]
MPFSLIEADFTDEERADLRAQLREALVARSLTDEVWWRSRALPLLLLATEVGYDFGERQAVYWRRLEEEVCHELSEAERSALSRRFRGAGLKREPPDVPWARQAKRIAWPISQAIAPRWLHAPLLELLGRCPVVIDDSRAYLAWVLAELGERDRLQLLLHRGARPGDTRQED